MAIKMEQHPTKQTPDYKSQNRRMEGKIQKILQGRDYPISSTYLDTQTSPTHIYSNKNNHYGV